MKSDFDFCQGSIKKIFSDKALALTLAEKYGVLMRYRYIMANFFNENSLVHIQYTCPSEKINHLSFLTALPIPSIGADSFLKSCITPPVTWTWLYVM